MRILMIAHIGETLGHLIRGLAIADELTNYGQNVEFATSREDEYLSLSNHIYKNYKIRWRFSHNSCNPGVPTSDYLDKVLETNISILNLLNEIQTDLIIGLPGIFTSQVARKLKIPHISILHGPYLSPIIFLENASELESIVLEFARKIFIGGCVDIIYKNLSNKIGVPKITYNEYLHTEKIFVPQFGLPIEKLPNIHIANFIRASFGPKINFNKLNLESSCYITFGTGNPCDITNIIKIARKVFKQVIVTTGNISLRNKFNGVIIKPFISSSSLVGKISAVISHGGIGTVGTFTEYKTPQIIIPTEIDQATMAIFAKRLGIAEHLGLDSWAENPRLGRHLPKFEENRLEALLQNLKSKQINSIKIESNGAKEIASFITRTFEGKKQLIGTVIKLS